MKKAIISFSFILLFSIVKFSNANDNNDLNNKNVKLVHELFKKFNAHDWEAVGNMYTDKASFKFPDKGNKIIVSTIKETIERYEELHKYFPDIQNEIINIYPSKNSVIVEFISRGNSADNIKLELPICIILTFENGKIIKDFTYYNDTE